MNKILKCSAREFCHNQKIHELEEHILQKLPVSSYVLPNGDYRIISNFSDDEWKLEDTRFPVSSTNHSKIINFKNIPSQFVEALKLAILQYDINRSPSGRTLVSFFKLIKLFLNYLDNVNFQDISSLTPLHCSNYVHICKNEILLKNNKRLAEGALIGRFNAIETLYKNLKNTKWAFEHPWVDNSSYYIAVEKVQGKKIAKTKLIPESELRLIINHCNGIMEQANELICFNHKITVEREDLAKTKSYGQVIWNLNKYIIRPNGYKGFTEFKNLYNEIPIAMIIIILTFSGIRLHELCSIKMDAYRTENNEDEVYYWLKSHSSKTYEGYTEWLVPEIVIKAIEVQKQYIKPLRDRLLREQEELLAKDPNDDRGLRIEHYKENIFLTNSNVLNNQINPLYDRTLYTQIAVFGNSLRIKGLAAHRFRRTFAVYVAQSTYGDLRYLKKHFKHWSMDMTLLYAANEDQDSELYDEIAFEIKNFKIARVEEFLSEDVIITGGLANKFISYRSSNEMIKTFDSRAAMAERISDTVHLRSTGHSWCTSDNSGCGGRSVIEGTACAECDESIIEKKRHGEYFKAIFIQQLELRQIDDIGEAGQQRVERDIERCKKVLTALNMLEEVKEVSVNG
jgi:integrase